MSNTNKYRWSRISTFEEFENWLATPDVVIACLEVEMPKNPKGKAVKNVENFGQLVQNNFAEVDIINVPSYINYGKEPLSKFFNPSRSISFKRLLRFQDSFYTYGVFVAPVSTYITDALAMNHYFNLKGMRGFYVLQGELRIIETKPLLSAADIPADGIVYHAEGEERFICEYPKGYFQVFSKNSASDKVINQWTNLPSKTLPELDYFFIDAQHLSWQVRPLNLKSEEGLTKLVEHLKNTVVSNITEEI